MLNDLFSVSNFSLEFAGNDLLLFIIPPFVGLTYVVYSRTYPEVRGKWFWILVGLRSIAFSLIIALLLEPVLAFWNRGVKNPRLLLMVEARAEKKPCMLRLLLLVEAKAEKNNLAPQFPRCDQ